MHFSTPLLAGNGQGLPVLHAALLVFFSSVMATENCKKRVARRMGRQVQTQNFERRVKEWRRARRADS